jgi:Amt family ammonium transporter
MIYACLRFTFSLAVRTCALDILWMLFAAMLVFVMQAGFLCLESGLVRSKNSINVAAKNLTDFAISSMVFWALGFAMMFGDSVSGIIGTSYFFFGEQASPLLITTFLFQMMFCGTAATLVSGAIAERMSYFGYVIVTITITLFIYPIVGHWAWAGIITGTATGWLEQIGFVDFAGSTVVHSVGGWVALAAILVIGPRVGRYDAGSRRIPGSNVPMAVLGTMLIWFGWFGFNGGSTLGWSDNIPSILLNTCIAAFCGGIAATAIKYTVDGYIDVMQIINGVLGGLVAITANCHAVSVTDSALIGLVAGMIVVSGERLLDHYKIDDAVSVIPVHLFAGIWGTLAIAIFADPVVLGTHLSSFEQFQSQSIGIVTIGLYSFVMAYSIFRLINHFYPLRVSTKAELIGLNVAEHRVSTEVFDLLSAMNHQHEASDYTVRVPVEPFTEIGQIAQEYNRVIDKVHQEIQQRDQAFSAFKKSEYRKGAILDAAMDCIITINCRGEIISFNPAAENCFGIGRDLVNGKKFFSLFMSKDMNKLAVQSLSQGFSIGDGLVLKRQNIAELRRYDKDIFSAEIIVTKTTDPEDIRKEYTLHIRDITKQVKMQNRLKLLAYNDPLTGLYNRTYFMHNMEERIAYHSTRPGLVALMFLDLDKFKQINDTLGHKIGDDLLCEVAKMLSSSMRELDIVGRWGGDEFVIVMSGDLTEGHVIEAGQRILEIMREPIYISETKLLGLFSIGIAISVNGDISADQLLQYADLAMYQAKQKGRNRYQLFSYDMLQQAQQQFQIETSVPNAISLNQFFIEYQPKVACATNEIVGFEALLRWHHPEHGLISPADFIPIIEGTKLVIDVGEWVMTEVMQQLVLWRREGLSLLPIAINISGHHLHDSSLVPTVQRLLDEYDINPDLIEVEITESCLTGNTEQSIAALLALKSTDIKLAIDDFGTGYSSLSYLKKFPIDILKIDRAFIIECNSNKEDAAICIAIITLAKSLGLKIVAEGVETYEQLKFLKQYDCDVYQGYYFSRPLGVQSIALLL